MVVSPKCPGIIRADGYKIQLIHVPKANQNAGHLPQKEGKDRLVGFHRFSGVNSPFVSG